MSDQNRANAGVYTTTEVAGYLSISAESVRSWTEKYQDFLSPSATPPDGKTRRYNDDDLRVLLLVQQSREQFRMPHPDIIKRLKNGERAELPDYRPTDLALDNKTEDMSRIKSVIVNLRERIEVLMNDLEAAEDEKRNIEDENIRLAERLTMLQKQLHETEGQQQKIIELSEQIAVLRFRLKHGLKDLED